MKIQGTSAGTVGASKALAQDVVKEFAEKFGDGWEIPDSNRVKVSKLPAHSDASAAAEVFSRCDSCDIYQMQLADQKVFVVAWTIGDHEGAEIFNAMGKRLAAGHYSSSEELSWQFGGKSEWFDEQSKANG